MAKGEDTPQRTNGWDMCSKVLIYGMKSGQLIGAIIGLILVISFFKFSGDQIYAIFKGTVSLFRDFYLLGWVFTVLLLIYVKRVTKKLRISQNNEMKRVADTKSELQVQLSEGKIKRSKGQK